MKIVNYNHRQSGGGLWKAWNKQYCCDLNRKINSLYDFMHWNYPEYVIFNSPTPLIGDVVHDIDLQSRQYEIQMSIKTPQEDDVITNTKEQIH